MKSLVARAMADPESGSLLDGAPTFADMFKPAPRELEDNKLADSIEQSLGEQYKMCMDDDDDYTSGAGDDDEDEDEDEDDYDTPIQVTKIKTPLEKRRETIAKKKELRDAAIAKSKKKTVPVVAKKKTAAKKIVQKKKVVTKKKVVAKKKATPVESDKKAHAKRKPETAPERRAKRAKVDNVFAQYTAGAFDKSALDKFQAIRDAEFKAHGNANMPEPMCVISDLKLNTPFKASGFMSMVDIMPPDRFVALMETCPDKEVYYEMLSKLTK
jgi:hypothetical protein